MCVSGIYFTSQLLFIYIYYTSLLDIFTHTHISLHTSNSLLLFFRTDTMDSGCSPFLAFPVFVSVPYGRLTWFLLAFDCTLISHYYLLTYYLFQHTFSCILVMRLPTAARFNVPGDWPFSHLAPPLTRGTASPRATSPP